MGLTKDQWYEKLRSWVPTYLFEQESANVALFKGMARLFELIQIEQDSLIAQTFINNAVRPYLDLHGDERLTPRVEGEFDPPYRVRIRSKGLASSCSRPDLLEIINALLIRGVAAIKEDWEGAVFASSGSYVNRGEIILNPIKDAFTIVVDRQVHEPYSFADREFFSDVGDFVGQADSSETVFQLILESVNSNKAFGALYRIIERIN